MQAALIALLGAGLARPAAAAVVDAQPSGFELQETAQIAAPPERVYAAIGQIGQWWMSQHTYSGDAKNLTLDLTVGGCFCERLRDGGGTRHMVVDMLQPNRLVRLAGALGPLAGTGGAGHLAIRLAPKDGGTALDLTYDFGGYAKGGMAQWAAPVDGVLGEQVARLKRYVETGKPD
ncbi:MAG TPA: SRPBCC domain-containing protein [Caulobacteraceae bacterium]|nr:SRPBCC domain-containing protein [Caulobacteraceae bacterium]